MMPNQTDNNNLGFLTCIIAADRPKKRYVDTPNNMTYAKRGKTIDKIIPIMSENISKVGRK
jgi:hypothetical protein